MHLPAEIIGRDFADEAVLIGNQLDVEEDPAFKRIVLQHPLTKTVDGGYGDEIKNLQRVAQ